MSLKIHTDRVTAVMVGGTWHEGRRGTFMMGTFDGEPDGEDQFPVFPGGGYGIDGPGFGFLLADGERIYAPANHIEAVKVAVE